MYKDIFWERFMTYLKRSIAALLFSGTALSAVANSNYYSDRTLWDVYPYLGIDVQNIDYWASRDRIDMIGVVGGLQFNDYLGLELNWSQNTGKVGILNEGQFSEETKIKHYGVGVTFQADLYQRLYAKSYVGYGKIEAEKVFKEDVITAKLGLGYQISPDFAVEATYNNSFTNDPIKGYANSNGAGIQLKYYF